MTSTGEEALGADNELLRLGLSKTRFYGRKDELDQLLQAFERIRSNGVAPKRVNPAINVSTVHEDNPNKSVDDSGEGIAPDLRAQLLESFAQVTDGCDNRSAGLGLGLAIAYRLVRLMGG